MSRTFKPDVPALFRIPARLVRAVVLMALLAFAPAALLAQGDSTTAGWLRFRGAEPLPALKIPAIYRSPWAAGPRPSAQAVGQEWLDGVSLMLDSLQTGRRTAWRLRRIYGRRAGIGEEEPVERRGVLGLSRKYADLNIEGTARIELRTERLKNLRCTPAQFLDLNSGCRGGFKAPRLDTYLSVRSGGLIGRRLHVDVDYDTERDFNARNNLQIYYEGLEDEIVRRVEVGTVTFRPPPSRFITAAIPANNFGVNATFQVGALQLQGIAATQKGSVVAERAYTVGGTTVQPQDREARDIDFESSRFFWVVDPLILAGFPAIDILQIDPSTLPPAAQINQGDVRVYRYRPSARNGINPNLGGINAVAIGEDTAQRVSAQWQLLQRDLDYYVDPTGVWMVLSTRLDQNDYLAVSYRSAAGQVGTFPSQDGGLIPGQPPKDTLLLIVQPKVDASRATFRHEIRNAYRVAGSDLDPNSLKVTLTLNRSERPLRPGAQPTYLAELGLAVPADPNSFNLQDRLFPRSRDPNASITIKESYIVFPTLQPFADPARLVATERNDSLYRTPGYLLYSEGPPGKFLFRLRYNASAGGDRSSLDLGALQIRDGSEALFLNGRRLDRGTDYTINYDLGQVSFLDPQGLFGNGSGSIQARFEERGIFAVAPTQIYGLSTRYSFGEVGGVNLLGIYQVEQSAFNRPQLGFEASAQLVGGMTTDLRFQPNAVTRFLNHLTSTPATAPSRLDLNAEVAFTKPDPNRSGQAYLEEFEGDPGVPLSLRETLWEFGSKPEFTDGVQTLFGAAFDTTEAVQLTWQNLVPDPSTGSPAQLRARDIDNRIQVAGQQDQLETVLYMTLHPDTAGGQVNNQSKIQWTLPTKLNRPRWRSMVTSLTSTGVDLSKNEFLEFWVFHDARATTDTAGVQLVLDLGSVSEDAIAAAPESLTVAGPDSVFTGRQFVGLGRLDTEREPTGIFNAAQDDNGILGDRPDLLIVNNAPQTRPSLCRRQLSNVVPVFPWGDLGERCGNGNGVLDAEDLDGDNQLDATGSAENTLRWVVDLRGTSSPYFVRDGVQSTTDQSGWRLYRIPLRTPEHTLGAPNIRLIKHLRFTVVGAPDNNGPDLRAFFAFARMRFLGSPWVRRSDRPVSSLDGATSSAQGEVVSSTVSTENVELGYTSPPGVLSGLDRKGGSQGEFGTQVNERSLRLIGRQITLGQRAEAYLRFPSGAQNLLRYRQLRWWARGRGPGWDPGARDFEVYLRVGTDSRNFYQYRTNAQTTTWGSEISVDLDRWRALRAKIESQRLQGPADSAARVACGGDTLSTAYVLCDGPYLAFIQDPAVNPPNLANVQEVAAGILRTGQLDPTDSAEVWVDDIRLVEPISQVGSAVALDARLVASDVGDLSLTYLRQDGYFQQIGQDPSYRTTGTIQLASGVRLERFLPASLGLVVPVQVSYSRSTVDPQLLTGTDIKGADLVGLRKPESWSVAYNFSVRRTERGRSWLVRGFLDPLSFSGSFTNGKSVSELSQATSSSRNLAATYSLASTRHGTTLNLGGLVRLLPKFLRGTEGGRALERPFLNLAPASLRFSSGLTRLQGDLLAFQAPVRRPTDALLTPVTSLTDLWRNSAGFSWQPLGMLNLSSDLASTRDLRRYADSTTLGRVATAARKRLAGLDVGVERDRQFTTGLALTPRIVSWLRPRYLTGSSFVLSRSLTSRQPIREDGDTAGTFILPQTLNNTRFNEVGMSIDISRLFSRIAGDSSALSRGTRRVRPFDVSDRLTRSSTFDLAAFSPSLGYQFGLGGRGSFLRQQGDSAIGAAETRNTTFQSGAELPLGASFTLAYSRVRTNRFQHVPGSFLTSETSQREWPKGNVRITRTLRGSPISVIGIGTTFRGVHGTTVLPSFSGRSVRVLNSSSTWTPDAQITLRNGMVFTASYSILNQENESNGNLTVLDQKDLTAGFTHAFALPTAISRVRRIVRSQLSAVLSKSLTCLRSIGDPGCASVSDTRRQEYRANFDTEFARVLTGGLQFSYVLNDARSLDRKFSQIILSASFQLSLFAGDYR
ncbi:MAG: cell surface protein SprA [Gemmatimonadota bacterium]